MRATVLKPSAVGSSYIHPLNGWFGAKIFFQALRLRNKHIKLSVTLPSIVV
jgi:hypothetical protein